MSFLTDKELKQVYRIYNKSEYLVHELDKIIEEMTALRESLVYSNSFISIGVDDEDRETALDAARDLGRDAKRTMKLRTKLLKKI